MFVYDEHQVLAPIVNPYRSRAMMAELSKSHTSILSQAGKRSALVNIDGRKSAYTSHLKIPDARQREGHCKSRRLHLTKPFPSCTLEILLFPCLLVCFNFIL